MENISQGSGDVRVDATTTVPPLRPSDAELIAGWGALLRAGGYASSSIQGSTKRLETFARRLPYGLLKATKQDVSAFYVNGEASARRRQVEQQKVGLRAASIRYFNHPTWANFLASAKQFYAWAEGKGLITPGENPLNGIREYRRASTSVTVQPGWYEAILHHPTLKSRDKALLWLLAHGLTPGEVLSLTPTDVNLEIGEVYVRGQNRARTVLLSDRGIEEVRPWVTSRYMFDRRWLFPSRRRGRPLSDRGLREIVQAVARKVFPHPAQAGIRRQIYPLGFRHVFVTGALERGMPVDCLMKLTGMGRAELLTRYLAQATSPERTRAEFLQMVGHWQGWIGSSNA